MIRLNKWMHILLLLVFLIPLKSQALTEIRSTQEFLPLIEKVKNQAAEVLEVKERRNLLVVTNASFTRLGGEETLPLLDSLYEQLGCSYGRKNLILLRSNPYHPLYLFFFNREKEKAAYFEVNPKLTLKNLGSKGEEEIFSRVVVTDLGQEDLFKNPGHWEKRFKEKIFGGNEARLISVSFLWREGISQEILKAMEIHDHVCPGLLSGYFLAKFVLDELPPQEETNYFVIVSPVWCKDDLIQSYLNTTPGKRSLVVLPLSDKEREHLREKDVAGIFFQFPRESGRGKILVPGFDWKRLEEDAGVKREGPAWLWRMKLALFMAKNLDQYKKYAYLIKRIEMEKGEKPEDYFSIGLNPWKRIGLWTE